MVADVILIHHWHKRDGKRRTTIRHEEAAALRGSGGILIVPRAALVAWSEQEKPDSPKPDEGDRGERGTGHTIVQKTVGRMPPGDPPNNGKI